MEAKGDENGGSEDGKACRGVVSPEDFPPISRFISSSNDGNHRRNIAARSESNEKEDEVEGKVGFCHLDDEGSKPDT